MTKNIVKEKSFHFAVKIVNLYKFLMTEKKEFILSKQLLKSGTAIAAMIREAEYAESKQDFIHKFAIAQKEANETIYWLELLKETHYLTGKQFTSICDEAVELIKLITSIIKSTKSNLLKSN